MRLARNGSLQMLPFAASLSNNGIVSPMAQRCPECHTINDDRLGRCGACGGLLSGEKTRRRWEPVIAPYVAIAVLLGLIAVVLLYLLQRWRA